MLVYMLTLKSVFHCRDEDYEDLLSVRETMKSLLLQDDGRSRYIDICLDWVNKDIFKREAKHSVISPMVFLSAKLRHIMNPS